MTKHMGQAAADLKYPLNLLDTFGFGNFWQLNKPPAALPGYHAASPQRDAAGDAQSYQHLPTP